MNEATARIKINKLLEAAGWRFFAEGDSPANICLEPNVTIKAPDLDSLGNDFEKTSPGFIDFLLLDAKGFPVIVLEAKSEDKNPLIGKEQARKYARSQNCRFVILSNGNPYVPSAGSVGLYDKSIQMVVALPERFALFRKFLLGREPVLALLAEEYSVRGQEVVMEFFVVVLGSFLPAWGRVILGVGSNLYYKGGVGCEENT